MSVAKFLFVVICAAGAVACFNFVVDPLQIFRPAQFYKPAYPTDERIHNVGLIGSQNFDTIFMGDSISLHTRGSEIDRHLGTHSVKLVMSGSTSREQNFVLNAAFARQPEKVVWQMDDLQFANSAEVDALPHFPADLYRRNLKGLAGYLFNLETNREAVWSILRKWKPLRKFAFALARAGYVKYDNDDPDELNVLSADLIPLAYNAKKSLAAYTYYSQPGNGQRLGEGYAYDIFVQNFERDAVQLIESHPNIRFIIYFPPYSMVQYAAMRDFAGPKMLPTFYRFSAYALQRLSKLNNVTLFDFRDAAEISHNLDNFADGIHHSPATGELLMSRMAKGDNLVDKSEPTRSVERLKSQVDAYKLPQ